jgi:hypothetical protein
VRGDHHGDSDLEFTDVDHHQRPQRRRLGQVAGQAPGDDGGDRGKPGDDSGRWVARQRALIRDGEHVVINIVDGSQKIRNLARDGRVAVNIVDADDVFRYWAVRGRVIDTTTEGGAESIEEISQKYLGMPYPNFTGMPETRVLITIEADRVTPPAWG